MSILLKATNIVPDTEHLFATEPVSFEIDESSIAIIFGPQKSLTSMWLKTLTGINAIVQGDLSILNHDIRMISRDQWLNMRKDISYVGKDAALLTAYTLMENILLPALYHKMGSREELLKRAYALLDSLGFDDRAALNQLPAFVTPLQAYYTKIVRALIVRPKLIFIDDIYANLSHGRCFNLQQFLNKQLVTTGISVVMSSSDIKHVMEDASLLVFLSSQEIEVFSNQYELLSTGSCAIKAYLAESGLH